MRRIASFLAFWYDFLVGEDWRLAAGTAIALALTFGLSHSSMPSWWVLPIAIALLLPLSVWRTARHRG
jgi:hypothetical protein